MAKPWQVFLATAAIFVAGLVTGGATALGVVHWVGRHRKASQAEGTGPFGFRAPSLQPTAFGPQIMRGFEDRLDLSQEQRVRIAAIVRRAAWHLGRQRRETQLSSAVAMEHMQDEVASVLSPAQRLKFDELISEQRQRLQDVKARARLAAEQEEPSEPSLK